MPVAGPPVSEQRLWSSVPMITAAGGNERVEFHRQNSLIHSAWPHCFRQDVPLPGRHHFSAVDALGDESHLLYSSTLSLLGNR